MKRLFGFDRIFALTTTRQRCTADGTVAMPLCGIARQRFKQVLQTLKETLADVKVFQVGKPESDVYIVGRVDSGWAGLRTKVVET